MILLPQRLFNTSPVKTILRDGNSCVLRKTLQEKIIQREAYISNHVISIVLAGEQHIRTYDDNTVKVGTNELIFIPRGVYYVTDLLPQEGHFQSLLFYFDDETIRSFLAHTRVTDIARKGVPDHLKFELTPSLHSFVNSLAHIYEDQQIQHKGLLRIKTLELLFLLDHLMGSRAFANFLFLLTLPQKRNIKAFMQANYDKPLKVEDYAYLTGRSESTFRRDFKTFFATTPQKWLKEQRLEKALQLLNKKEMSVADVAYEVGYENTSYFIRAFKEKAGLSPKQYMLAIHRQKLKF